MSGTQPVIPITCGSRFMFVGKLASHAERHTQPSHFWCSLCQHGFLSITELTGHQCQYRDGQSEGLKASQGLVSRDDSVMTIREGSQRHVSTQADASRSANSVKSLASHLYEKRVAVAVSKIESKHGNCTKKPATSGRKKKERLLKEEERPHKCPECPATFLYASVLQRHLQRHTGKDAFPCPQCSQAFPSRSKQLWHQEKDHWGSTPITCHQCGKVFSNVRNLEGHLVLHTGEKPYTCKTCGESFQYRQALCRHRHSHKASYSTCKACGAEFHLNSEFKAHMNKHEAILPHLCSVCGTSFSTPYLLKKHAVTHGRKQFVCEHCGKAFHRKEHHKMHARTHLEVKPFPCPLCDRSFVSQSKLRLHESVVHLGVKPHICDQCDARFAKATALKDHIRSTHTKEKPYVCSVCSLHFHSKKNRGVHFIRHHKKH